MSGLLTRRHTVKHFKVYVQRKWLVIVYLSPAWSLCWLLYLILTLESTKNPCNTIDFTSRYNVLAPFFTNKSEKKDWQSPKRCLKIQEKVPDNPKTMPKNFPADQYSSLQLIFRHVSCDLKTDPRIHTWWSSGNFFLNNQATFLRLSDIFFC